MLIDDSNKINGWAFTFFREDANWFPIILDSRNQGKGNGSLLISELKKNNNVLNGWVTDETK